MSHIEEPGICYCACHDKSVPREARERHVAACCQGPCPVCKKNYSGPFHVEACQKQRAEAIAEIEAENWRP